MLKELSQSMKNKTLSLDPRFFNFKDVEKLLHAPDKSTSYEDFKRGVEGIVGAYGFNKDGVVRNLYVQSLNKLKDLELIKGSFKV